MARFLVFERGMTKKMLEEAIYRVKTEIAAIHDIEGYSCTLFTRWAFAQCNEAEGAQAVIKLVETRLEEYKES